MTDLKQRKLERKAAEGDPEAIERLELFRAHVMHPIPGYDHLVGNRVLLLGARWHYEGMLKNCTGKQLVLDDCRQIFNYSVKDGVSASDDFGHVLCNHTHVASASLSPFKDKTWTPNNLSARPKIVPEYAEFINKKVFLLGARWHYFGMLLGSIGDYFLIEDATIVFNYDLDNGIQQSDVLPGTTAINTTHVSSVCFNPFKDQKVDASADIGVTNE